MTEAADLLLMEVPDQPKTIRFFPEAVPSTVPAPSTCRLAPSSLDHPLLSHGSNGWEITVRSRDRSPPTASRRSRLPEGAEGSRKRQGHSLALQTQDALKDDPTHAQQQEYKAEHAREDRQGGQQRGFFPQ